MALKLGDANTALREYEALLLRVDLAADHRQAGSPHLTTTTVTPTVTFTLTLNLTLTIAHGLHAGPTPTIIA